MLGLNSRFDATGEKPLQALVLEAYDHGLSITGQSLLFPTSFELLHYFLEITTR
jgi:hypothetical protein